MRSRRRRHLAVSVAVLAFSIPVAVSVSGASGEEGETTLIQLPLGERRLNRSGGSNDVLEALRELYGDDVQLDTTCSTGSVVATRRQLVVVGDAAPAVAFAATAPPPGLTARSNEGGDGGGAQAALGRVVAAVDDAALVELAPGVDPALVIADIEQTAGVEASLNHVMMPAPVTKWKPFSAPTPTDREPVRFDEGGAGMTVAVVDTGIPARRALGPIKQIGQPENWDADNNGVVDYPAAGHGLFISSLISNLMPEGQVVSVNVTGENGLADEWSFLTGVRAALAGDPARGIQPATIINASLGAYACNGVVPLGIRTAVEEIQAADAILVAAAGNERVRNAAFYPAALSCPQGDADFSGSVVSVGALDFDQFADAASVDADDMPVASFSNTTGCNQLFAAGTNVVSRWIAGARWGAEGWNNGVPAGEYVTWSGTSMAAPVVASAIAREAASAGVSAGTALGNIRTAARPVSREKGSEGATVSFAGTGAIVTVTRPAPTTTTTTTVWDGCDAQGRCI